MALIEFQPNTPAKASEVNANFKATLTLTGLNTIRQLMDRAIEFSKGQFDGFGDAYVDADGQLNSVDTTSTNSVYNNDYLGLYYESYGQLDDSSKWSYSGTYTASSTSATIGSTSLYDTYSGTGDSLLIQTSDGYEMNINAVFDASGSLSVVFGGFTIVSDSSFSHNIKFIKNNSGGYDYYIDGVFNSTVSLNDNPQVSISVSKTSSGYVYNYVTISNVNIFTATESIIYHNVPSGTFSSTISSSFGVPFIANWEDGADIQYKLTNGTDDTGWLNINEIASFTAFTSEPTQLIVKLIPTSTTPTAGYPSIKGFWVYAE